jgi:hypothetical protein
MGWSQDVHESRTRASIAQARQDYRLQRRGYAVPLRPDAKPAPFVSMVAALASLVWWRKEGRRLRGRDWRRLPLVRQFYELLTNQPVQASTSVRSKLPKSSGKAQPVSRAPCVCVWRGGACCPPAPGAACVCQIAQCQKQTAWKTTGGRGARDR